MFEGSTVLHFEDKEKKLGVQVMACLETDEQIDEPEGAITK